MPNLTILSRDIQRYLEAFETLALPELNLLQATELPHEINPAEVEILLGEPDLAAQILPACQNLQWLQSTWAGNKPLVALP
ncbi:MAG: D-2-hydroxyacid dehydrogenase, partial [Alteromonas sp.]